MKFAASTLTRALSSVILGAAIVGCNNAAQIPAGDAAAQSAAKKEAALVASAEVHNPSDFARPEEVLYFSYYDLGLNGESHQLNVRSDNETLQAEQADKDLDGQADGLYVVVPLKAAETRHIEITHSAQKSALVKRTQAEIATKQGGEWQAHSKYPDTQFKEYVGGEFVNQQQVSPPEHYTDHSNWIRYEGPGIESDQVGYRIYLDHRNGFDIFGKLTTDVALQQVGQDGYASYHDMQDWGMDILKVGSSLGAGGFGLWQDETLHLISDASQRTATILDNSALQSAFSIDYQGWKSPAGEQDLAATFAMQAGSPLVNVTLDFQQSVSQMAVGVVKHKDTELLQGNTNITGTAYTYIASWGKQSLDGSMLGMAVFFPRTLLDEVTQDEANYLAILSPEERAESEPMAAQLTYSFAAVWQPQSGIADKQAFKDYLDNTAEQLTQPARVRLKTQRAVAAKQQSPALEKPLYWSQQLADSELERKGYVYAHDGWDVNRQRPPKFEYDIVGLYPYALYELAKATDEAKYKEALHQITGSFISDDGNIKRYKQSNFNIDSVAPGRSVLALYKETGEQKYKQAADILRAQLVSHPKTSEGAFWHKKKYPHQLWLDGVYMGMPFLAEYSLMFEDGHSLEEVVKEFELTHHYLKDATTGLYYHAWDEAKQQDWADSETGLSAHFWGRGLGWLAMALVDVLEIIPEDKAQLRMPLITMAEELALALSNSQDETGTWWQIMDKPGATGNYRESSGSAMFVYFLAKSVANGYIAPEYQAVAEKAYEGLISEFVLVHDNGEISMTNQCYVAGLGFGRDGSYQYYMSEPVWQNDPKGTGPFILAGIAMQQMLQPVR